MKPTRRDFLRLTAAAAVGTAGIRTACAASAGLGIANPASASPPATGAADRAVWCAIATKLASPLLSALAEKRLKAVMPVESHPASKDRPQYTHLEGFARLLAGLAPWLELGGDDTAEGRERARIAALARAGVDAATDPASPDFMNFKKGGQPLVDAAFLAQAFLRAPKELWEKLEARVRENVVTALKSSRPIPAGNSNWKLFATTVEVFLQRAGEKRDDARLMEGVTKHQEWYLGDGMYGDGPEFHWDYYNSFVIQPMFVEALDVIGDESPELKILQGKTRERLARWAAVQERLISPDGSYPAIGRSIAYRCGAFQGLAMAALRGMLPPEVKPAQARAALTRVIRRTLETPGTFDAEGWLRIGLAGAQPALGEPYISTGSLYLCSVALLPLGLPASAAFWSDPAELTTWEKAWSGVNLPVDKAIKSPR
ncbi:MAG TPA: DUF2264 domain-containing protein [Opitutaceae bacterium]|nr:DUF2264 domain-containing protein [Opitutaceae bacterium]